MAKLADDYWLIAPDTPGFGESFVPSEPPSIPFFSQAIHETLMTFGMRHCWLFGHHTGAAIAADMACRYPHLVLKLVLSGPPLLDKTQKTYLRLHARSHERHSDGSHLIGIWQNIRTRDPEADLSLSERETILALKAGKNDTWACEAALNYDFAGALANITSPTLVMSGGKDNLISSLEPTAAALNGSRSLILPDAGTYISDRQPGQLAEHLRKYFR